MPELLTKHPDIVLKILKDSGLKCGLGGKPQILTSCPPDSFCQLPTGELCIYGLNNMANMTQIDQKDLNIQAMPLSFFNITGLALLIVIFALGIITGIFLTKKRGS